MMKVAVISLALICFCLAVVATDVDKCAAVDCAECHECRVNDQGEARCVYKRGCCPGGQQQVNCFVSPCMQATTQKKCPSAADCIEDYCGGCNAHYYDKDWNEICTGDSVQQMETRVKRQGNPCRGRPCPRGTRCVFAPKQCFAAPCPQYNCV